MNDAHMTTSGPAATGAPEDFFSVFHQRAEAIADACTRCGDCFRACPMTEPGGISAADPSETAGAIVDLITGGDGNDDAIRWARSAAAAAIAFRPASTASTRALWSSSRAALPAATATAPRSTRAGASNSRG